MKVRQDTRQNLEAIQNSLFYLKTEAEQAHLNDVARTIANALSAIKLWAIRAEQSAQRGKKEHNREVMRQAIDTLEKAVQANIDEAQSMHCILRNIKGLDTSNTAQ